jgi:hypothetical protein
VFVRPHLDRIAIEHLLVISPWSLVLGFLIGTAMDYGRASPAELIHEEAQFDFGHSGTRRLKL